MIRIAMILILACSLGCASKPDPAGEARTRNRVTDAQLAKLPKVISVDELEARWGPSEGQPGPCFTYRAADHKDQFFWVYYRREIATWAHSRWIVDRIVLADRIEEGGVTVWPPGYIARPEPEPGIYHPADELQLRHTSYKMEEMLLALPQKFWESRPGKVDLGRMFPRGVPEDFVSISTGGAQNDFEVLRLNGSSIAIAVGDGENPDYAASIHPKGRNLEVLKRGANGWQDITKKVFPRGIRSHEVARLYRDGRLVVSAKTGRAAALVFQYDGTAFASLPQ